MKQTLTFKSQENCVPGVTIIAGIPILFQVVKRDPQGVHGQWGVVLFHPKPILELGVSLPFCYLSPHLTQFPPQSDEKGKGQVHPGKERD